MSMATHKNKAKQCPKKEREREDTAPPRTRTGERSFLHGCTSSWQPIQDDCSPDSVCLGHFSLR
jgi:hypothetical protein